MPCSLERSVHIYKDEKAYGKRIIVRISVRHRCSFYHLRCHISSFAEDAHAGLVGCNVIVIADEHIARLGIDEEVAIVHILIAQATDMEFLEGCAYLKAGVQLGMHISKLRMSQDELAHILVLLWAQFHHIAHRAVHLLCDGKWPYEVRCGSPCMNIVQKIFVEGLSRVLVIPLQGHFLSRHLDKIDNALSALAQFLFNFGTRAIRQLYNCPDLKFTHKISGLYPPRK